MHVWVAAEIPDHGRAFDLPNVPNPILADILVFIESHVKMIEAVSFDQLHGLIGIAFPERGEQVSHDFANEVLLVAGQFGERNSRKPCLLSGEFDSLGSVLLATIDEKGEITLAAIESLPDIVGAL